MLYYASIQQIVEGWGGIKNDDGFANDKKHNKAIEKQRIGSDQMKPKVIDQ